ncbi:MAG TPA: cytochrome P450 [Chitinophaga sp.]|uniref:cytochrome P450 n=1 Tax=Chitinophaga sp. TaxID=1869181 RepID=UPI002C8C6703|nr:cytochrome P450 [Chitinophaga sp.]HVI44654.1 cytochrome P450 [Chitinophaga sp.]
MNSSITELSRRSIITGAPVYDPGIQPLVNTNGVWQVNRHKEAATVLADHRSFSGEYPFLQEGDIFTDQLIINDPLQHTLLRSLTGKAFSTQLIYHLETMVRRECHAVLAPLMRHGEMEFVSEFAQVLPFQVISRLLGIPARNNVQLSAWVQAVTCGYSSGIAQSAQIIQQLHLFFIELIQERWEHPQEDFITRLLFAEAEGERFSTQDVIAICFFLFFESYGNIKNSFINVLQIITAIPGLQAHLAAQPSDISQAIAEALRLSPASPDILRIAVKDILISGTPIQKGQPLHIDAAAVNRDSAVFTEPHTFNMTRTNHCQVLASGAYLHQSIEAPLTTIVLNAAFETLLIHAAIFSIQYNHPEKIFISFQHRSV